MPRPPALVIFDNFQKWEVADGGGVDAANLGAFALGGGRASCGVEVHDLKEMFSALGAKH